jgi:hypothetical protein
VFQKNTGRTKALSKKLSTECFFLTPGKNVHRVSDTALGKASSSARQNTLGKAWFAECSITECKTQQSLCLVYSGLHRVFLTLGVYRLSRCVGWWMLWGWAHGAKLTLVCHSYSLLNNLLQLLEHEYIMNMIFISLIGDWYRVYSDMGLIESLR